MADAVNNAVYVNMMEDSLRRKQEILEYLYERTERQAALLVDEDMDTDEFKRLIDEKGLRIDELTRIDEGFDRLFRHVEKEIQTNRMQYKEQIQRMQKLISRIVELGVQLQALEQQNTRHFEIFLNRKRQKIRTFREGNRTVNKYYQNATSQKSFFFDESK